MGELSVAEEVLAALALTIQLSSTAVVAVAAGRWAGAGDRLLAWAVGWTAGIAFAVAVPLGLGMLTVLDRTTVVLVHAAVLVVAAVLWARGHRSEEEVGASTGRGSSLVVAAAVGAVAAYLALAAVVSLGPPSRDTDTREYHVTNLATWLREGSIWELPYQSPGGVTATHPGDAEVLALWLSLPTHGDELAYLMPVVFGLLLVLGAALLARGFSTSGDAPSGTAAVGAVGAVVVLTAPIYLTTQTASLSNDVTVAACTTMALALLAAARPTGAWRTVAAAGVALGLGLGSKYTALVPTATLAVAALWLVPRRRLWWWLVPGVAALALPWYVRNLVETGNPVFPQEVGPLSGGESPLQVMDDPVAAHFLHGRWEIVGDWLEPMARHVGPVVVLAAVGALLALRRGPRRTERVVAAVVVAAAFAGYLAIPFSGGGPTGLTFLIVSSLRYSMTAVAVGTACWAALAGRRLALWSLGAVAVWNLWQVRRAFPRDRPDVGFGDRHLLAALVVGAGVALVVARGGAIVAWLRTHARPVLAGAAVAVIAAAAMAFHRYDRGVTPSPLEQALLVEGDEKEPVVVLGVLDLRALLGPRLHRPLVGAPRGGEVGEIPFADESQVRRAFVGDEDAAPAPASFRARLDEVVDAAGTRLLVVGPLGGAAYPEGWVPDDRWCAATAVGLITVFERC